MAIEVTPDNEFQTDDEMRRELAKSFERRERAEIQETERASREPIQEKQEEDEGGLLGTIAANVAEVPRGLADGLLTGIQEPINTMLDLIDAGENFAAKMGVGTGDFLDEDDRLEYLGTRVDDPKTLLGGFAKNATQFFMGFFPASRALNGIGRLSKMNTIAKAAAAGAVADFSMFDPDEKRMSNFFQDHSPVAMKFMFFLAADEDDTRMEGRFKNMVEGLGLGVASDLIFKGFRHWKINRTYERLTKDGPAFELPPKESKTIGADAVLDEVDMPGEQINKFNEAADSGELLGERPGDSGIAPKAEQIGVDLDTLPKPADQVDGSKEFGVDEGLTPENIKNMAEIDNLDAGVREEFSNIMESEVDYKEYIGSIIELEDLSVANARKASHSSEYKVYVDDVIARGGKPKSAVQWAREYTERVLSEGKVRGYEPGHIDAYFETGDFVRDIKNIDEARHSENVFRVDIDPADPNLKLAADHQMIEMDLSADFSADELELFSVRLADMAIVTTDPKGKFPTREVQLQHARQVNGLQLDKVKSRKTGELLNASEIYAANTLVDIASQWVFRHADLWANGTKAQQAKFMKGLNNYMMIVRSVEGSSSEVGAALKANQFLENTNLRTRAKEIDYVLQMYGGTGDVSMLMHRINAIKKNKKAMVGVAQQSWGTKVKERVFEYWINQMLSGISTQVLNIGTNVGTLFLRVGERKLAEKFSKRYGHTTGVAAGEAGEMLSGMANGFYDSLDAAFKTFQTGVPSDEFSKIDLFQKEVAPTGVDAIKLPEFQSMNPFQQSGMFMKNLVANAEAARVVGGVVKDTVKKNLLRIGGRSLMSADEFFKAMNLRAEVHALVHREMVNHKGFLQNSDAANIFYLENIRNPPKHIMNKARQVSRESTFTQPLDEGGGFEALDKMVKKAEVLNLPVGRIMVPFMRTNLNALEFAMARVPGMHMLLKRNRLKFQGGEAERALAQSQLAFGSMIAMTTGVMAYNGFYTGNGPKKWQERQMAIDANWRPNALKIGNTYISFDRLDPLARIMGLGADIAEMIGYLQDAPDDDRAEILAHTMGAVIMDFATPELLTENLGALRKLREGPVESLVKFVDNTGKSLVPLSGFLRGMRKLADPVVRDTHDGSDDFIGDDTFLVAFEKYVKGVQNTIPGLSRTLPPARNVFGNIKYYGKGMGENILSALAPIDVSTTEGVVQEELIRLGMSTAVIHPSKETSNFSIGMPPRSITMSEEGVRVERELSPEEYDKYVMLAAGHGLDGFDGVTLEQALKNEIDSGYEEAGTLGDSDEAKRIVLKSIFNSYRNAGRDQFLLEEENVANDLDEKMDKAYERIETGMRVDI
jgi:hypothetical protein